MRPGYRYYFGRTHAYRHCYRHIYYPSLDRLRLGIFGLRTLREGRGIYILFWDMHIAWQCWFFGFNLSFDCTPLIRFRSQRARPSYVAVAHSSSSVVLSLLPALTFRDVHANRAVTISGGSATSLQRRASAIQCPIKNNELRSLWPPCSSDNGPQLGSDPAVPDRNRQLNRRMEQQLSAGLRPRLLGSRIRIRVS